MNVDMKKMNIAEKKDAKKQNLDKEKPLPEPIAKIVGKSGPSEDKGWDVRVKWNEIHVTDDGRTFMHKEKPYYIYEDFPGGKTHWHDEKNFKKIVEVKREENGFVVEVENELGEKVTRKLSGGREINFAVKAKKIIERIIKREKKNWLSTGNLKPIALPIHTQKKDTLGNYPYEILYNVDVEEKKGYVAVVRLIDGERYSEVLIRGRECGLIYDPQLVVSVNEVDLNTETVRNIYNFATDRNDYTEKTIDATEYDRKITFSLKPGMILTNEEVGVLMKFRIGKEEWTTESFKCKRDK